MSQTKSRDWLAVIGNFSVVAGLILVAFQINQSAFLVRAEIGSSSYNRLVESHRVAVNASFADVWAKSLEQPENLTITEMIQLDGYLYSLIDALEGDQWLYDIGIYEGSNEDLLSYTSGLISSNRFAMSWWTEVKSEYKRYQPVLVDEIDRYLSSRQLKNGVERLKRIQFGL